MNQFKRAQIIMLPTDKPTRLINYIKDNTLDIFNNPMPQVKNVICQHLYIISDEKIKEVDWCLLDHNVGKSSGYSVLQCLESDVKNGEYTFKDMKGNLFTTGRCEKIIATTDSLLNKDIYKNINGFDRFVEYGLPQPSQQFIEKYIELFFLFSCRHVYIIINVQILYTSAR